MWLLISVVVVVGLFGLVVLRGAPYVPSHRREVALAFTKLYPLSARDVVVDLGSGDGVVLRQAARLGARAIGYELNPLLVAITRLLSLGNALVSVHVRDMWRVDVPADTTVVYVFTVSRDTAKLKSYMERQATRIGRPLHVIMYGHTLGGLTPVKTYHAHHLYKIEPLQEVEAQV